MKRKKDPVKRRLAKIRSALRNVWRYDYNRRAVLKDALDEDGDFKCPICKRMFPEYAADVDHLPPLGGFTNLKEAGDWMIRLFEGPQRVLCKPCHKAIPTKAR